MQNFQIEQLERDLTLSNISKDQQLKIVGGQSDGEYYLGKYADGKESIVKNGDKFYITNYSNPLRGAIFGAEINSDGTIKEHLRARTISF
jgi:hypothetical protein